MLCYEFYDYLTNLGLLYLPHNAQKIIYPLFTFFEFFFFAAIFYKIVESKIFKKLIVFIGIFFIIFLFIYHLTAKITTIDSIPIGIETILILIFSFYYLYERMQNASNLFVYSLYSFWLTLGMMLYLSASFFIYIFITYLKSNNEVDFYWMFTNIFSILKNIFFTIAIIINAKQSSNKTLPKQQFTFVN